MTKKFSGLFLSLLTFLLGINNVNAAATASLVWSGPNSVATGGTIQEVVNLKGVTGSNVNGISGEIKIGDTTCLSLESIDEIDDNALAQNGKFVYSSTKGTQKDLQLVGINLKAGSNPCTTTVTIKGAAIGFANGEAIGSVPDVVKTITVGNAPSTSSSTTSSSTTSSSTSKTVVKSNDANLKSLAASGYTLSPAFDKDTLSYEVVVPSSATYVTLTGAVSNSKAKVTGIGNVTLTGDVTTQNVVVTAEDGTTKTYTVVIKKQAPTAAPKSSDATLKKLNVSGYTLNPIFKSSVTNYTISVGKNINGLKVDAIANDPTATVTVTGNSGWKDGVNVITIKVVAEDGTTKVYTVNANRGVTDSKTTTQAAKSSDNTLSNLIIGSSHTITPKFSKDVTTYDVVVPYEVNSLDLTPVLNSKKASYKVTGNDNFKVGEVNVVTITISAEDGSQRVITLNVTRNTDKSENDLEKIEIEGYDLNPKFKPDVLDYTLDVPSDVDELNIKAIAVSKDSKVEVIGNKNLREGENIVLVKVTDKNGYSKYYQIKVNKEKKETKILGFSVKQFAIIASIIGGLLLLLLILFILLFKRRKDDEEEKTVVQQAPVIDFKPEFNFGSRNGTDDDIVYTGGTLNQGSNNGDGFSEAPKGLAQSEAPRNNVNVQGSELPYKEAKELPYVNRRNVEEVPYDMYDDIVTKDELIDAIQEGLETRNPEKLKMLLEQEELNRKKEELRRKEEQNRRK